MSEAQKDRAEITEAKQALVACVELANGLRETGLNGSTNDSIIVMSNLAVAKSILALTTIIDSGNKDSVLAIDLVNKSISDAIGELKATIALKNFFGG